MNKLFSRCDHESNGFLALQLCGQDLPLQVLKSQAGFYIGTADDSGPVSRESEEYWAKQEDALHALNTHSWMQRVDC